MGERKTYLGDSVYAEFDGFQIVLSDGEKHGPEVAEIRIDPSVLRALNTFYQTVTMPKKEGQ